MGFFVCFREHLEEALATFRVNADCLKLGPGKIQDFEDLITDS